MKIFSKFLITFSRTKTTSSKSSTIWPKTKRFTTRKFRSALRIYSIGNKFTNRTRMTSTMKITRAMMARPTLKTY